MILDKLRIRCTSLWGFAWPRQLWKLNCNRSRKKQLPSVISGLNHRWRATGLLAVIALLSGCASTSISALHDPLYRASSHTSTISATARNTSSGISSIDIVVTTGEMTNCTELGVPASVIPCRRNASVVTHTCNFPTNPDSAVCDFTQTLGNRRLVTYQATANPASGSSRSSIEMTYAGGTPPAGAIARPVLWQRSANLDSKLDIAFFPDADYGTDYLDFTTDLQNMIEDSFFNSTDQISKTYTLFRNAHNLWAGPFGADAGAFSMGVCPRSWDTTTSTIAAATDGEAIVHLTNFRDCAAIALGGAGSMFGKAGDVNYLVIHESAHFLHGQGDEYLGGGNWSPGPCRNVFASQAACQLGAAGVGGASTANCVQIGSTGTWRNDDGQLETMDDRNDDDDFRNNSARCVIDRLVDCGSGSCY